MILIKVKNDKNQLQNAYVIHIYIMKSFSNPSTQIFEHYTSRVAQRVSLREIDIDKC
jgi:hypothetical protein